MHNTQQSNNPKLNRAAQAKENNSDLQADKVRELKSRLLAEKKSLLNMISRIEETGIGDTMSDSVGELSMYDNHPADLGDVVFERSKDVALRDNEHVLLERVETALAKMEEGTYGLCDVCGQPIDVQRLEALPLVTRCIRCQQKKDKVDVTPRPLEEEVLAPPFHRTFLDTASFDDVAFDGEDSLQAALSYGSSDTPQDIPGTKNYKRLYPNSNEQPGLVEYTDAIPDERKTIINSENEEVERQNHSSRQALKDLQAETHTQSDGV